jgi:hypothetical protein
VTESAALASRHGHSKPPVEAPELYDMAVRFPHVAALLGTDFSTLDTLQFATVVPSALHTSSSCSHLMIELSGGERCFSVQGVGEQINNVSLRRDREILRTIAQGAVDSKLGARPVGEKAQVLLRQRLQKRVTFDHSTGEPAGLKVKSTVLSCDELGGLGMGIVRGLPARVQQQGSAQQAAGAVPAGTSCTETAARQVPSPHSNASAATVTAAGQRAAVADTSSGLSSPFSAAAAAAAGHRAAAGRMGLSSSSAAASVAAGQGAVAGLMRRGSISTRAAAPDAAGHRVAGREGRRGSGEECSRSHAAASAAAGQRVDAGLVLGGSSSTSAATTGAAGQPGSNPAAAAATQHGAAAQHVSGPAPDQRQSRMQYRQQTVVPSSYQQGSTPAALAQVPGPLSLGGTAQHQHSSDVFSTGSIHVLSEAVAEAAANTGTPCAATAHNSLQDRQGRRAAARSMPATATTEHMAVTAPPLDSTAGTPRKRKHPEASVLAEDEERGGKLRCRKGGVPTGRGMAAAGGYEAVGLAATAAGGKGGPSASNPAHVDASGTAVAASSVAPDPPAQAAAACSPAIVELAQVTRRSAQKLYVEGGGIALADVAGGAGSAPTPSNTVDGAAESPTGSAVRKPVVRVPGPGGRQRTRQQQASAHPADSGTAAGIAAYAGSVAMLETPAEASAGSFSMAAAEAGFVGQASAALTSTTAAAASAAGQLVSSLGITSPSAAAGTHAAAAAAGHLQLQHAAAGPASDASTGLNRASRTAAAGSAEPPAEAPAACLDAAQAVHPPSDVLGPPGIVVCG